jgi:PAS domain S-box-containing protein
MPLALKVLLLEDNPADAELVLWELRRAGFAPDWQRVDSEAHYLEQLHAGLDVIISDYAMPQFNGLHALDLLNRRGLDIPFIIVSGTIGEETAVTAMKHGAADYLLKDRLVRLGPAVSQALERSRLRRERHQADEALRLAQARLGQLLAHSPAVLYGLKVEGEKIIPYLVSENVSRLLGFSMAEASGSEWWLGQLHPDDRERVVESINETLGVGASETEYRLRHRDGHYCWVNDARRLVLDATGTPVELIGVWTDITERKLADQKIREQLAELLRWQEMMLDREEPVIALKAEVNALLAGNGKPPRYGSVAAAP